MNEKNKAMILASFAADSLALGVHWIYDTQVIDRRFGRVEHLLKPMVNSYHPMKNIGEFTHYGDQSLALLESIALCGGFDLNHFAHRWKDLFKNYKGYFDEATKVALKNFAAAKEPTQSGSVSSDLAGASRIAPLAYRYRDDIKNLVASSRAQTAMTHNNLQVIESAEFFVRAVYKVLRGNNPLSAIKMTAEEGFNYDPFDQWIKNGLGSTPLDTRKAIRHFGQMCEVEAAFPSVVHLIAKYESDLKTCLVENVMAGGDSAGRGMIAGMILGAYLGLDAIPNDWLAGLKRYHHIIRLLKTVDAKIPS